MSTEFASFREAMNYLLFRCGLDSKTAKVEEVPDLRVAGMETMLLDNPDTSEAVKQDIRSKLALQKGYKVETPNGELKFVIAPFRDGVCCWILGDNGAVIRL